MKLRTKIYDVRFSPLFFSLKRSLKLMSREVEMKNIVRIVCKIKKKKKSFRFKNKALQREGADLLEFSYFTASI